MAAPVRSTARSVGLDRLEPKERFVVFACRGWQSWLRNPMRPVILVKGLLSMLKNLVIVLDWWQACRLARLHTDTRDTVTPGMDTPNLPITGTATGLFIMDPPTRTLVSTARSNLEPPLGVIVSSARAAPTSICSTDNPTIAQFFRRGLLLERRLRSEN